jgi:hypothetical protein
LGMPKFTQIIQWLTFRFGLIMLSCVNKNTFVFKAK